MNTPRRHLPSLERLRALREVARLGGFSAAAKALGLTQPAISNHVRLLEQQLGTKLLERIGKTARPTREGETLIAASARAFGSIDLGLLTAPVRDRHLSSRFFFRDRLVCIAPPAEAPTAKAIRPRDLESRQLFLYDRGGSIRRAVDAWLDAA